MHTAAELIELIEQTNSFDYWYDNQIIVACELLQKLAQEEFDFLLTSWQRRSDDWNLRFASILNCRECFETAETLAGIIHIGSYRTASIALVELAGFENIEILRKIKNLSHILDSFEIKFFDRINGSSIDREVLEKLRSIIFLRE